MNKSSWIVASIAVLAVAAVTSGQGASQPVKSAAEYFVTSDGGSVHLWVREGTALRVVSHGKCEECAAHAEAGHDHAEHEGHDHGDKKDG